MYAIVDIETTGGYAAANGITEISIIIFDGNKIVEKFETLVNPCRPIPRFIQSFTGINDEMVSCAPRFEDIAEQVFGILNGKIFVAHNVNFDYSFIKAGLQASGYSLQSKKLCTVRLSRKIFPGLPSYQLDRLCDSLNVQISNRHRAGGDAEATVKVFEKLLTHDKEQHIQKSLMRNSKENMLPPNVPKDQFEKLPSLPGVYYFHDQKGKVIYVGKARNIRNRVNSHFSSGFENRQKQNFIRHTYSISYHACATELMASIMESAEIKKFWPEFNYSQKRREDIYGIFSFEDQNGYLRLAIEKNKKLLNPVHTFQYLVDGHSILRKLIREFDLSAKLCFLQKDFGAEADEDNGSASIEVKEKAEEYNKRVAEAIASLSVRPSYAIIDKGLNDEEYSCILIDNGKFYGMGYLSSEIQITEPGQIKEYITPYKENGFIHNLVNSYAMKFPSKVIHLSAEIINPATESFR